MIAHRNKDQRTGFHQIQTARGLLPILVPNSVTAADGFYISYNDRDIGAYGCDTTALVIGQMEKFFILKGDHRAQYAPLIGQGLDACMSYFKAHADLMHVRSDKPSA